MNDIDYAARVARGIALMDEKWPNWATEIDLDALDIEDGTRCVTAQYSSVQGEGPSWINGRDLLGLDMFSYEDHGLKADDADEDTAYPTLNALWKAEIVRRREAAQPEASER